jgi:hypothetical protein
VNENVAEMAKGQSGESAGGVSPTNLETVTAAETISKVHASGTQQDLLSIIWKNLQEDREKRDRDRKLDEEKWMKIRGRQTRKRERDRKLDEEKWERKRKEDEERWEKLSEKPSDLNPILTS